MSELMQSLFQEGDIEAGTTLLSENKVGAIIFSGGTYQVEVLEKETSYWIFLQFDTEGHLSDYFCMCEKGEKEKSCKHLTAAFAAIYRGHKKPLHIRFAKSFWNKLFQAVAKQVGYKTESIKRKEDGLYVIGDEENPFFALTCHSQVAKERLKEWVDERVVETEETSLKFSNLSMEELEDYRRGIIRDELRYELSFWSDLAKGFMISEDFGHKPRLHFHIEGEGLPNEITFELFDMKVKQKLTKEIWMEIIPTLVKYETSLRVHEFKDKEIEKITFDEAKGEFCIHAQNISMKKKQEDWIHLGDWIFVPGSGFFPKTVDPILQHDRISKEDMSHFLTNYMPLLEKYSKDTEVHTSARQASYDLYFDQEEALHVCCYLFAKGDLQVEGVHFYDPWVYIPKKGFYLLKGLVFKGVEKIIPREMMPEFIERHKNWLSRYEDYRIHLTSLESKLYYKMESGLLKIYGDETLQEKSSDVIDFGHWIYVKKEGFFSKGKDREGEKKVYPGLEIKSHEISNFIEFAKEELEQIKGFFYIESGLEKTGLIISLGTNEEILVEPKYYFRKSDKEEKPQIFGNYVFYPNRGFAEIPQTLRIPKKYSFPSTVSNDRVPYFIKHELPRVRPYLIELDRKLTEPLKLRCVVKAAEPQGKWWKVSISYVSSLGEIRAYDLRKSILKFAPYIFSDAGMISLKNNRFSWLMKMDQAAFDPTSGALFISTLDWIKLSLYEEIQFAKPQNVEQKKHFEMLSNLGGSQLANMPNLKGLKSKLRPYQAIGVQWLWFLYSQGLPGGFLCDDMGLGKTHQTMALLAAIMNEKRKNERSKFLVICPTSVMYHWQELLDTYLKKARVLFYHGPFRSTRELKKSYDLILTTYGIVRSDKELFKKMKFEVIILDEVQVAKNERSQINQTLKQLEASMKLALTGTPIENNLSELKSLFDIAIPKFLPTNQEFKEQFILPIEKDADRERSKILAKLISPFILRRRKQDVLEDLPEKCEEIAYVDMAEDQRRLYEQVANQSQVILEEETTSDFYLHVFALLNKLKQICNHPAMIHKDIQRADMYGSGKWELFTELIDEARRSGQKVVVFSQFLDTIAIMEQYLKREGIEYACIKGSTQNRKEELNRFQKDPKCDVFLGSLGAAGVGIDLTAASIVIHYDRWWNPAKENQATDRVHRIGQKRGVMVFKLVTKGTIEEHIHQIIEKKKGLIDKIIGYDNQEDFKKLDREEIVWLLKQIQKDIHQRPS